MLFPFFVWETMATFCNSVCDAIGKTPMVKLGRSLPAEAAGATVLAKLEMQNPGGSVKDRIAKSMMDKAEAAGTIAPDRTTIVEYTSGNTGIGLAMICAAKGYKCVIIMPQLPPMKERYVTVRKFGADVHLTAPAKGVNGMKQYMEELVASDPDKYWCPQQFTNAANPDIHFTTTGPEVLEQAGGKVDYFISGVGTGGTVVGVGKFLKSKNPDCKVIAVEPTESRVLVGQPHTKHAIVGIGPGITNPFIEELAPGAEWKEGPRGIIDEFLHAAGAESTQWCDTLAKTEGLLVGPSTGAVMKVAADVASRPEAKGKTIVVVFPSSGIRYIAHPSWGPVNAEAAEALPAPPNMDQEPLFRWKSPA